MNESLLANIQLSIYGQDADLSGDLEDEIENATDKCAELAKRLLSEYPVTVEIIR